MANSVPKKSGVGAGAAVLLILGVIFGHEGGFVDDANDPGGATRYGITEAVARANGYEGAMSVLPLETAKDILISQYIKKPGFMPLIEIDPALAHEVIDSGVNAGPRRPSCWFQEGLNAFNNRGEIYPDVKVDCDIGPATIGAYRILRSKRGPLACELMMKYLDGKQLDHYASLGRNNSKFETFMVGWVRTRIGNVKFEKCYSGEAV
ncbi:glycoside hydrolase family 108 protein [Sphingorhabdus sp. 109]|uniref:glycoside hydrolase family 108 protein n=1 Tax=Sphingorhabdus sp. 109 TaxID=2653173 RepID=UPI0012EFF182|nr:glycosyl hydrolase 108 family protein [Sphingorhabdus sp. 109]VWX56732.1 conserved hypothetical protein [Sphingorhabdus sp. 109]